MSAALSTWPTASSRPIRVLHMGSPAALYGAERWILALIKHLPAERIESWVGVIKDAPDIGVPLCELAAQGGYRTHVFESYGRLSGSAIGQLRRFIIENAIDILHTHFYKTDLIGCLAVRGTSCKILSTPHGWSVNAGVKLQVYEALDRLAFLFMDAVAPLSEDLRDGLKSIPGLKQKLHLIENGVDLTEIDVPSSPPEPLKSWRAAGRLVIGYVGQLITRKRIDTLIEAFHRLETKDKQLCIIGDGPQRDELEALADRLGETQRVAFLGFRHDRIPLLKGFDIFVLPSELEGIPRCLMEAAGAGIPVIASDIPGCRDLVLHGKTGLLFKPGDAFDLHMQIARIAGDEGLRAEIAREGCRRTRSHYSAQAMAQKYTELYGALMCERTESRDFLVFSDDWGEHPSSCQHIFSHISKDHRVLWVNTIGMRNPTLTFTDLRKIIRKVSKMLRLRHARVSSAPVLGGIKVCQPFMLPFSRRRWVRAFNAWSVTRSVRSMLRDLGMDNPIVVTTVPNAAEYPDLLRDRRVVYYCVDDFTLWPGLDAGLVRDMEARLIKRSDTLIAVSRTLSGKLSASGSKVYLLTHGVDLTHFAALPEFEHPLLESIPHPRAGFFGLIDGRMDRDLVESVARRMPRVSFVFAGPVDASAEQPWSGDNVHFVGPVRYADLPALIAGFDVLLLPYKCGELAEVLSPLKLNEYLATGKPVVSTPIAEARNRGDLLSLARSPEEWERAIIAASGIDVSARRTELKQLMTVESWEAKAAQFIERCMGSAP